MKKNDERWTLEVTKRMILHRMGWTDFDLDLAASSAHHLSSRYYTKEQDALSDKCPWNGNRMFLNPPFSDIGPWVKKAEDLGLIGSGKLVMLVPANRTEQPWWQDFVEPLRDLMPGYSGDWPSIRTEFLRSRTTFGSPEHPFGIPGSPRFGCVLLMY